METLYFDLSTNYVRSLNISLEYLESTCMQEEAPCIYMNVVYGNFGAKI